MLKALLIIFSILYWFEGNCQKDKLPFYYPDGKKYVGKALTMEQISNELEPHGRVYIFDAAPFTSDPKSIYFVGYKLFTDEALWVVTENPETIDESIYYFDLTSFFKSREFEHALETHIKKKTLTDSFILKTLGQPDKRTKYFDSNIEFENWNYRKLHLELTLTKGVVTSYIKIN